MGELWRLIEAYRDAQTYRPSINQLATKAGIGRSTVNRWQEIDSLPNKEHLEALARVLGLPYQVVLDAALRDTGYLTESEASSDGPTTTPMKPNVRSTQRGSRVRVDAEPRTKRTQTSADRNPSA